MKAAEMDVPPPAYMTAARTPSAQANAQDDAAQKGHDRRRLILLIPAAQDVPLFILPHKQQHKRDGEPVADESDQQSPFIDEFDQCLRHFFQVDLRPGRCHITRGKDYPDDKSCHNTDAQINKNGVDDAPDLSSPAFLHLIQWISSKLL